MIDDIVKMALADCIIHTLMTDSKLERHLYKNASQLAARSVDKLLASHNKFLAAEMTTLH